MADGPVQEDSCHGGVHTAAQPEYHLVVPDFSLEISYCSVDE